MDVKILETDELKNEMECQINSVLPDLSLNNINFSIGTDNSPEGIYIYMQNDMYHYVITEKGKVCIHRQINTEEEVLWIILNEILFQVALDYAIQNRIPGKDFRRKLFEKEIELFSKFGVNFGRRKDEEINEILKRRPYNDK